MSGHSNRNVKYEIVDLAGDLIDFNLFKLGCDIPVKIVSIRFEDDDTMIIRYQYLHGAKND